ncbi:hypothetical protein SLEP1_g43939 [Rubroshorea leprosula]|uniref:Methylenetetrahydrofolate reductase n=1 Tax=Rubroshorea leprosula TaxID=152421 RepID=A0AAV5LEM5_9ROSI|nr:hypothetical protein SLEP1_g43939 [Rubroshorea leprosula]
MKIDHALGTVKSNGIQKVLALRGDPPHGQDKFVKVQGGFACALDLVQHIRRKYGDYFGNTVAASIYFALPKIKKIIVSIRIISPHKWEFNPAIEITGFRSLHCGAVVRLLGGPPPGWNDSGSRRRRSRSLLLGRQFAGTSSPQRIRRRRRQLASSIRDPKKGTYLRFTSVNIKTGFKFARVNSRVSRFAFVGS